MKVKITNGAKNHWYENLTGSVFNVLECSQNLEAYLVETPARDAESSYIYMRDCEEVYDELDAYLNMKYKQNFEDAVKNMHMHYIPEEIKELMKRGHVTTIDNVWPTSHLNSRIPNQQYDFVNPSHYKKFGKETYQMMIDIWGKEAYIAHCEMCAFKYKLRAGEKPDQPVDRDLDKANWYLEMANKLKNESME